MKCGKPSFAVFPLFAALLSLSIGTLNARNADLAPRNFAAAQTAKQKCMPCTLSRLSSSEPGAIVPVSGCLPGLHPIQLYWFRARMTDVPFAAVSGAALYCARSSWIVDDAECLLSASRRFVVAHQFGRYWSDSGHSASVADGSIRRDGRVGPRSA